jgi:pyridoxal/pyridoxine/pyridoxamine kinase
MAVGMVSSANNLQNSPVLRAGEKVASTPQALKDPKARTYKHMVPGARFVMPDGLEVQFLGGQFVTTDPDIIAQLEAVANKSSSMIYTDSGAVESMKAPAKQAAADAADTAGTASN